MQLEMTTHREDTLFMLVRELVNTHLSALGAWLELHQHCSSEGAYTVPEHAYDSWIALSSNLVNNIQWIMQLSPSPDGEMPKRWQTLHDEALDGVKEFMHSMVNSELERSMRQ